ncbi:MAG: disulfide bond formation protein DsbA, partial [Gammaproteobacteria bacterium]|nr:disulfide bond formation protein DsbA [Gammaproteobacteria bacterium]
MSIRNRIRSRLVDTLSGEKAQSVRRKLAEGKRRLSGRAHTVAVFVELDDPYSYLLAQYLPDLAAAYDVE